MPLLISLGIDARIGTGTAGLTTSLNYYQSLSEDLTDSLEEIANSLITVQNQLDSLAPAFLQNRRGLNLLTAEKGGLSLFLEEACCFYINKSLIVKDAARNLTNRASRICQHLSNSWKNWLSNWNWMPWVLLFLGPLLLFTLILTFGPCLMRLFSKFLQDGLQFTNWTIPELLLTHSDYQKLRSHTNPLDPHPSLFIFYSHNIPAPQEAVTEDWPLALILNQKAGMIGPTWGLIDKTACYADLTNKE